MKLAVIQEQAWTTECDILGDQNIGLLWPPATHLGGQYPNPQDLRPWLGESRSWLFIWRITARQARPSRPPCPKGSNLHDGGENARFFSARTAKPSFYSSCKNACNQAGCLIRYLIRRHSCLVIAFLDIRGHFACYTPIWRTRVISIHTTILLSRFRRFPKVSESWSFVDCCL